MNGAYTPKHFSTQRPGGVSTGRPQLSMMGGQGFTPSNPYWQPPPIPAPQVPQSLLQYAPILPAASAAPMPAPAPQQGMDNWLLHQSSH